MSTVHCQLPKLLGSTHDIHQFLKEPFINLGQIVYLINRISGTESFGNDKDTFISRFAQGFINIGYHEFLVFYKAMHALTYHTETFLDSLFKGTADSHHLAYGFHRGTQLFVYTMEFS